MLSLFLILCYFILIFNIIIPKISDKLHIERESYISYKSFSNKYLCVMNRLFMYDFSYSGLTSKMIIDKNGLPISCGDSNTIDDKNILTISCDTSYSDIPEFKRLCYRSYSELFFST
ncbi:IMv membrane protein [Cetacean poxvirus 1]|nr:IMv membrane protein [Cetacean poxvirus 1]